MNRVIFIVFILSCLLTHKADSQSFSEIIRNIQSDSDAPDEPDESIDDTDQVDLNTDDMNINDDTGNLNTVDSDSNEDGSTDVVEDTSYDQDIPSDSDNDSDMDIDTDVDDTKTNAQQDDLNLNNNQKSPYKNPQFPEDIRAASGSRFSVGALIGANFNFMGANCYDISSSRNICHLITNRQSNGDEWVNPDETSNVKLKARGFGVLLKGFLDWSANNILGVRVTTGWEHFSARDTVGSSVAATRRSTTLVDCSRDVNPQGMRVVGDRREDVCYAYVDYISISGLIRYKMDMYEDFNPWAGAGVALLMPIDWSSNFILNNEIPPIRGAFHIAVGLDINIADKKIFFPTAVSFIYPFNNFTKESHPKAIEDYSFSASGGIGYRF